MSLLMMGCGRDAAPVSSGWAGDTDAAAYFAALPVPETLTFKNAVDAFIAGLKADSLWTLLDRIGLFAVGDVTNVPVDMKNPGGATPAKKWTVNGTGTWTAYRGLQGNGTDAYINAGESPQASGNGYATDDAHIGVYTNGASDADTSDIVQLGTITAGRLIVSARKTNATTYRLNATASDAANSGRTTRKGHRMPVRDPAATGQITYYFNGTGEGADVRTGAALTGLNATVLRNDTSYSIDQIGAVHWGKGFNSTQAGNMHTRLHTLMTALGANY